MSHLLRPSVDPVVVDRSPRAVRAVLALLSAAAMSLLGPSLALPQTSSGRTATAIQVVLDRAPSYLVGPLATGYVTNDSDYRLTNVRLRVDATDAAGQPVPPTFGWVNGDVPARGRGWFKIVLPPRAGGFSISVISFDLVTSQSP